MLIYDLEKRGKNSIYEYLYYCIREDILSGKLKPGEKLPSKREMASGHKIAVITVENAYAQLLIEGYITSREKSGYFVTTQMPEQFSTGYDPGDSAGNPAGRTPFVVGLPEKSRAEKPAAEKQIGGKAAAIVDFTSNHTASGAFPFSTWAKLMRRVLAEREMDFLTKPPAGGVPELRQAISEYLVKAKGLAAEPERILVGPGTEYLHHIILQLIGHNRFVAVEDPGYKKVGHLYESNGLKCLHLPVDHKGLIVEKLLESNASLVHISPSHHFPTGGVMPIDRRHKILSWAAEQNAYIVEDDYDSEFRFDGRPVPTLAGLDDRRVIYMNTFTKTLAPSIRIAYMVLPKELTDLYYKKLDFLSGTVSSFDQYTLAAFIGEGYYERHISRMRNAYRQYRARILKALEESGLAEIAAVEEDSAGLHFILHIQKEIEDDGYTALLEEKGIRIRAVSDYCYRTRNNYRHKFLIHYSDLPEELLNRAFEIMYVAAKQCGK